MAENSEIDFDVAPAVETPTKQLDTVIKEFLNSSQMPPDILNILEKQALNLQDIQVEELKKHISKIPDEKKHDFFQNLELEAVKGSIPLNILFDKIVISIEKTTLAKVENGIGAKLGISEAEKTVSEAEKTVSAIQKQESAEQINEEKNFEAVTVLNEKKKAEEKKIEQVEHKEEYAGIDRLTARLSELLASDPGLGEISAKVEERAKIQAENLEKDPNYKELSAEERSAMARTLSIREFAGEIRSNVSDKNRAEVESLLGKLEEQTKNLPYPRLPEFPSAPTKQSDLLVTQNAKIEAGTDLSKSTGVLRTGNELTIYYVKDIPPVRKVWTFDGGEPKAEIRGRSGLALSVDIAYQPSVDDMLARSDHERAVRNLLPEAASKNPADPAGGFRENFNSFMRVGSQTMDFLKLPDSTDKEVRKQKLETLRANLLAMPIAERAPIEQILEQFEAAGSLDNATAEKTEVVKKAQTLFLKRWTEGQDRLGQLERLEDALATKEERLASERSEFSKNSAMLDEIAKQNLYRLESMGLGAIGNDGLYAVMERLALTEGKPFTEMIRRRGSKTEIRATEKFDAQDLARLANEIAKAAKAKPEDLFDEQSSFALRPGVNLEERLKASGAIDEKGEFKLPVAA